MSINLLILNFPSLLFMTSTLMKITTNIDHENLDENVWVVPMHFRIFNSTLFCRPIIALIWRYMKCERFKNNNWESLVLKGWTVWLLKRSKLCKLLWIAGNYCWFRRSTIFIVRLSSRPPRLQDAFDFDFIVTSTIILSN